MTFTKLQIKGFYFAFLGVFLFSASLPMTKLALQSFDPLFTAFARPLIALTIAVPLMLRARAFHLPRDLWKAMAFTTFGAVFGWPILIALALQRSTSTHIAVIAAVMPLVTALIAVLKYKKRVGAQFWLASRLAAAGVWMRHASRSKAPGNISTLLWIRKEGRPGGRLPAGGQARQGSSHALL